MLRSNEVRIATGARPNTPSIPGLIEAGRPQIRDLQYRMTDGRSFFHDELRHLDSRIRALPHHALGDEDTSVDREGRYRQPREGHGTEPELGRGEP